MAKYCFCCDVCKRETFVPERLKYRVINEDNTHICLLCKYNVKLG